MIRRARSVKEEVRRSEEARRGYIKAKWKRDCEREREDEEDGGTTGPGRGEVKDSPHKHLECDTLVSGTHIKALGREGV